MTEQEFYESADFSLEITGGSPEIRIQPYIDAVSDRARTLIASFQVDSFEMIESARIPLSGGMNHVPFRQPVRIVNPSLWHPAGLGMPSTYRFSVVFHKGGAPYYVIEKNVGIRFVELDKEQNLFKINGMRAELFRFEPDFTIPEPEFAESLRGNGLAVLRDHDPELDDKLDRCGRVGLMTAVELTGAGEPERFLKHPSVCFFTAGHDSAGERMYQERNGLELPLVFPEELEQLLK